MRDPSTIPRMLTIRTLIIQFGLKTLRRFAHSRFEPLNWLAVLSVELAPVSEATRYRLYEITFEGTQTHQTPSKMHRRLQRLRLLVDEVRAVAAWLRFSASLSHHIRPTHGIPINWQDLREGRSVDIDAMDGALGRLRKSPIIHVFCDVAANVDEVLLNPAFENPVSYTHLRAHETDSYLVCR